MKNNRAFTLVELLSAIVILAIIALIVVPMINSSISESKEQAAKLAVHKYIESVQIALADRNLKKKVTFTSCEIIEDGSGDLMCDDDEKLHVEIKGDIPTSGKLTVDRLDVTGVENINMHGYVFSIKPGSNEIELKQ